LNDDEPLYDRDRAVTLLTRFKPLHIMAALFRTVAHAKTPTSAHEREDSCRLDGGLLKKRKLDLSAIRRALIGR